MTVTTEGSTCFTRAGMSPPVPGAPPAPAVDAVGVAGAGGVEEEPVHPAAVATAKVARTAAALRCLQQPAPAGASETDACPGSAAARRWGREEYMRSAFRGRHRG